MLIHADPFAHYATAQYADIYANGPGGANVAIGAFGPSGRPGLRFSGDLDDSLVRTVATSGAVSIFQGDLRISAAPSGTNVMFAPMLSAAVQCSLDLNSDRTLSVHRGFAGTKVQLGSNSTYVVPLNTHIHIGVKFTIANSGGSILVHVWEDGDTAAQVVLNVTGVDTQDGASATWDGFDLGAACSGTTDWANVIVMDGSGSAANNLLGPADVWALHANARTTPALTDWSLSGGSSIPALLDDDTPDDDSTYCEETTQNQQVTVAVDPVPFPSRAILGAQLYASVKLTSGSPTLRGIGYQSATANLGVTFSPTAAYTYLMGPYSAMPDGAAFTTAAAFDALQWGLKLTTASTGVRVTQIVVALIQQRDPSRDNLLTGYTHTVRGDDNLTAGQYQTVVGAASESHGYRGSVIGHRSVLFSLDGAENAVTEDGVFEVAARRLGDRLLALLGDFALVKIEELTPTGASATFASLGQYTHLQLICTGRGDAVATTMGAILLFNGDTGNNYDRQTVQGAATTASAAENLAMANQATLLFPGASATSGLAGFGTIFIPDYRGTTFEKMAVAQQTSKSSTSSGAIVSRLTAWHWRNAAAITSLTISASSGNFVAGTKFSLYGVR